MYIDSISMYIYYTSGGLLAISITLYTTALKRISSKKTVTVMSSASAQRHIRVKQPKRE